jgi:transcriptional regulator with XRE-family HTH domain
MSARPMAVGAEDRTLLQAARRDRGWSQTQLIARLRTVAATRNVQLPDLASMKTLVSCWENGKRSPGDFYVPLLCEVYDAQPIGLGLFRTAKASPGKVPGGPDLTDTARQVYESRRAQLRDQAARITAELAYLDHVLSVPTGGGR